jgi:RND family efflux transporter MFP subunit
VATDANTLDSLRIKREPELAPRARPVLPWILAACVLLAGGTAYSLLRDGDVVDVRTVTPSVSSSPAGANSVLNASGYVVARRQATVSAKTTGKVAEVLVEEGMMVTEGQLLARLDPTTIATAYSLAERELAAARLRQRENLVRLAEAQRSLQRTQSLRADRLVSESQLDMAQSQVAALRARMAAMQSDVDVAVGTLRVRDQELDDLLVRAPFSGVVISKDAQPGEIISPVSAGGGFTRTGIATIVDMDSREIELDVNEAFISRVKDQQKTEAVLDAYPDRRIPNHVINIVPAADRQKATVRVRVAFDQLDPRILPDMGVKVSFLEDTATPAEARRTFIVPSSVVVSDGSKRYAWRVTDSKAERIEIRTSTERDGQIEILAGITSADRLIDKPAPQLADGVRVAVREE